MSRACRSIMLWDWTESRALAEKALEIDARNPIALAEMGGIEQTLGRLERALQYRHDALRLDPLNR